MSSVPNVQGTGGSRPVAMDAVESRRVGRRRRVVRGLALAVLIVTAILLVLPTITLFITSLKLDTEYNRWPITFFPKVAQWRNYARVFEMTPYAKYMARTALLGIVYACIITTTSALAGYGFARYRVPANGRMFGIVIAMLIIPGIVLTIPQFILYARLRLTNTYCPWILGALAGSSFYIFSVIEQSDSTGYMGSGGSGELYYYDLATLERVLVQQLPTGICTSADLRDDEYLYFSHFGTKGDIWSGKPGLFILHLPP